MDNFILLIICFLLGSALRMGKVVDESGPAALNAVIIYFSLPALALLYAHSIPVSMALLIPASMAWIVFAIGYLFFRCVGHFLGYSEKTIACLSICCGLGNTSFIGLPMIEALFGPEFMGIGMLCDTAGTFMVLAIPGIILATKASGQSVSGLSLVRKVISFPPLIAIVLGFLLQPVPYPEWFELVLERMGSTLAPLALLSVGMSLKLRDLKGNERDIILGLGYKMFIAPVFMALLYFGVLGQMHMVSRVTVFEAAMGPMITGGIVAVSYDLRPRLATSVVGVGIALSFVTLPLWYFVITAL